MRNCEQAAHEWLLLLITPSLRCGARSFLNVADQSELMDCTECTIQPTLIEHLRDADGKRFIPETTALIDAFGVSGVRNGALHLSNWSFHLIDPCDYCWCRENLGV